MPALRVGVLDQVFLDGGQEGVGGKERGGREGERKSGTGGERGTAKEDRVFQICRASKSLRALLHQPRTNQNLLKQR